MVGSVEKGSRKDAGMDLRALRAYPHKKRVALMTAALSMLGTFALSVSPAYAVLSAVAPTRDATTGLPDYFQDSTGLRITACLDGTAACAGQTVADFANDTTGEVEAFYFRGVAIITGPVVTGNPAAAKITQTMALEGGHDDVLRPLAFQRIRTRIVAGVPNASYSVVEPYGTQTIATNASGTGTTTQDIGCAVAVNGPACDFSTVLATGFAGATGSIGPFMQWDTGAPAGYIGDGVLDHTFIGSSTGNNFFSITGPGLADGNPGTTGTLTTATYVITGKIAPTAPPPPPTSPVLSFSANSLAFGNQGLGTSGAAQTVTVSNTGNANLVISAAASTSGDFVKTADTCSGATVAAGAHCTISVKFGPLGSTSGARSAVLNVTSNAPGSPHSVLLSGTATAVAGIAASPSPLAFGSNGLLLGGAGVTKSLTVTSNGTAPLTIGAATLSGANVADFTVTANTCSGLTKAIGATCTITIKFRAKATGARSATLTIASNAATAPTAVSLTGTGTAL